MKAREFFLYIFTLYIMLIFYKFTLNQFDQKI